MISILSLFENKPEHPNTIVIKNQFYPKGLIQEQIYDYYISQKNNILKEIKDREIIIFFCTNINKFIVKRRDSLGGFFKLDSQNYNDIISGRTVSIHSSMRQRESFGIIDIDTLDFNKGKEVTAEIYDELVKENKKISLVFTGKESFHIIYNFKEEMDINNIKKKLTDLLEPFSKKYHIGIGKRAEIGLDLSPNKFRGGFISLHSLSVEGLRCMEVLRQKLETFKKEDAIISTKSIIESSIPIYPDTEKDPKINGKFIIHQHKAIRAGLHYDLRLGKDGVLKSWASRKLPELIDDKSKKIIAFETPDHDSNWFDFQGEITDGYGAGKVEIWDKGTFKIITWNEKQITVIFDGNKLKGKYTFILYKKDKEKQWLLLKSS